MKFGWIRDLPDQRYSTPIAVLAKLPAKANLSAKCPPVYNQGQLGSCTANAIGGALEFAQIKQGEKPLVPSRLFIYYNERVVEGSVNSDAGAQIRDGIKVVNQYPTSASRKYSASSKAAWQQAFPLSSDSGFREPDDPCLGQERGSAEACCLGKGRGRSWRWDMTTRRSAF